MPLTIDQRREFNLSCYGTESLDEFIKSVYDSMDVRHGTPANVILSMLSDAQHEMQMGTYNRSRQTINRAKFLLWDWYASKERRNPYIPDPINEDR